MANGQGGVSPLQQFIGQYMETQAFLEAQRQAGAQEALASRQLENLEIQTFADLAQKVQQPEQLSGLIDFFGERTGNREAFESLAQNIVPKMETMVAGAARDLTPEEWGDTLAIAQGRKPTAADAERLKQGWQALGLDERRFDETVRQFGLDLGLRELALQMQHSVDLRRLSQQDRALGQQDRALGIQEFEAAQRGELGRLSAMTSGGLLPMMLMGEQSTMMRELQSQMDPEERAHLSRIRELSSRARTAEEEERPRILEEISAQMSQLGPTSQARVQEFLDTERSSAMLNEFWRSQFGGKSPAEMSLVELLGASEKAYDDIIAGKSAGEKDVAIERYNMVQELLGAFGSSLLERRRTLRHPFTGVPMTPEESRRHPGPSDPRQR